ncbi:MAG: hypothetical protein HKN16_00105 [Saprospiraceae bacterium]|nr:hypothetical protein [Saprospiraceae bacterium]
MLDTLTKLYDDFTKSGRVQDLGQLAHEEGMQFQKRTKFGNQPTELKSFKIFQGKGYKRLLGLMARKASDFEGKIRFYDFLETVDLETYTHSILEVKCDAIFIESLRIEPKGAFKKMKGFFISDESPFPALSEFNNQFQISSKEPDDILWLQEKALELMEGFKGLTMEAHGNYFIFYFRKKTVKIHEILDLADFAEEFVRLVCNDRSGDFV